jgi:hypothetical protein
VPLLAENNGWALQAAEKLLFGVKPQGFVKGHDFSRAIKAAK